MALGIEWQSSRPFKFIIDDHPVFIHEALVSAVSDPLSQVVHGDFQEAQAREATLPGVDYDTFNRFVHWAYTGFYLPAEETSEAAEDEVSDKNTAVEDVVERESGTKVDEDDVLVDDDIWSFSSSKKRTKKREDLSWDDANETTFQRLQRTFSELKFLRAEDWKTTTVRSAGYSQKGNLTKAFLSHAQVYVFADEKIIESLKRCALNELHWMLKNFVLNSGNAKELIPMIEYIYSHTPQRSGSKEPLRSLVSKYVGCKMDTLIAVKEFRTLFENSDFVEDFCEELTAHFLMQLRRSRFL